MMTQRPEARTEETLIMVQNQDSFSASSGPRSDEHKVHDSIDALSYVNFNGSMACEFSLLFLRMLLDPRGNLRHIDKALRHSQHKIVLLARLPCWMQTIGLEEHL